MTLITIPCYLGDYITENGNLHDEATRHLLINGFCGNVAEAVMNRTNTAVYFVVYGYSEGETEKFMADCQTNPSHLLTVATHAMVQSPTNQNLFLDAYGPKTRAQVSEFYGTDAILLEGTQAMLEAFRELPDSELFAGFAETILFLDKAGISYSYL